MAEEPQDQTLPLNEADKSKPQIPPLRPSREKVVVEERKKHTIPPELPYQKYHMQATGKFARGGWKRISINTVQSDDGRFTITQVDPTRRSKWFLLKDMETGESYEEPTMTEAKKKAKGILEKSALYESLIEKKVRSSYADIDVAEKDGLITIFKRDKRGIGPWEFLSEGDSYKEAWERAFEALDRHVHQASRKIATSYRVWMKSVPGPYSQYDGYVDVQAKDEADAKEEAYLKLRRTSFPDRGRSMWKFIKVEEQPLVKFHNQLLH